MGKTALDHLAHSALVERDFAAMVKRHLPGTPNPVGLLQNDLGQPRTRVEIMVIMHAVTEEWQVAHRDDTISEVVTLTAAARGATLQLIAELSDSQFEEKRPGAPWDDGTVAGVLGANSDHGRKHWK